MLSTRKDHFVHVIGFDFDGCLLPDHSSSADIDIGQANKVLLSILKRQGERAYAATYFYSSSNRQSWMIDDGNRQDHTQTLLDDPTSSFLPCKALAEQKINCTFWSYLLADAYSERPFGYSYARAILRARDDTAYHPGYVFDEHKFSLLYAQTHLAANNMRNCDFLSLELRPPANDLMRFPFKSNAAYIYIKSEKLLLYVNKAQHLVEDLVIKAQAGFDQMLANVNDRITNIEHDFEMFYQDNILIRGVTLSPIELKIMESISGHVHAKRDWLIIFDFYDDREDILRILAGIYKKQHTLLPSNLILRLNLYSANEPNSIHEYFAIAGAGRIDTKPGESVVNMAKLVLQKEEITEDDFSGQHSFSAFIEKITSEECFKNRSLGRPTITHKKGSAQYALHAHYNCILSPNEILSIRQFITDKTTPSLPTLMWAAFFNINLERNLYFDPIISLLKSLLRSQTEDEVVKTLDDIFDLYHKAEYLKTIGKNSDLDILLKKIQAAYIPLVLQNPSPAAKSGALENRAATGSLVGTQ